MPALMSRLVQHFDPTELAEFVNFMSHLAHKLEVSLWWLVSADTGLKLTKRSPEQRFRRYGRTHHAVEHACFKRRQ